MDQLLEILSSLLQSTKPEDLLTSDIATGSCQFKNFGFFMVAARR